MQTATASPRLSATTVCACKTHTKVKTASCHFTSYINKDNSHGPNQLVLGVDFSVPFLLGQTSFTPHMPQACNSEDELVPHIYTTEDQFYALNFPFLIWHSDLS
jgi:hypothetical protein